MEAIATGAFKALAGQGTGWLLFCIASAVAALLFRELLKAKSDLLTVQQNAQAATEVVWRERLTEKEAALTIIHAGTMTNQRLAENLLAAKQANEAVALLVQQMDQGMKSNDTHWKLWAAGTERTLDDILNALSRKGPR
jgi:hypothetical protein